jgi:hypothetical protein
MKYLKTFEQYNIKVYHGTSIESWSKKHKGDTDFYLITDKNDAKEYAYEEAARYELKGKDPHPILVSISLNELLKIKNVKFLPDWGVLKYDEKTPWQTSMKEVGSFVIHGNIDVLKPLFNIEKLY